MAEEEDERFLARLEQTGEAEIQTNIERNVYAGRHKALAMKWVRARNLARLEQSEDRADRALAATERSVQAAEAAAEGAQRTARWTMWIAVATFLAALATLATAVLQWWSRPPT